MPINQRTYEQNAVFLIGEMDKAQLGLIQLHGRLLERLSTNPGATLEYVRSAERHTGPIARAFNKSAKTWASRDVPSAYLAGVQHANTEARPLKIKTRPGVETLDSPLLPMARLTTGIAVGTGVPKGFSRWPRHLNLVNVFKNNAAVAGDNISLQLIRGSRDVVRKATELAGTQLFKESSVYTRRKFSQNLLDRLAKKGIGHVTYANGRKVSLEAYTEMVGRTMTGRAAVTASLARYQEMGVDLVIVSAHCFAKRFSLPADFR